MSRHKTLCACLGLAGLSLALYSAALGFGFVNFDDPQVLLAHPYLYNETSLPASLHQIFVASFPREEPLLVRDVSWAVDARLFGFENPLGYHLGNVILNAANAALLFLFLQRATRRFGVALAVAAAFSVLPVHVEPVCWVMGRKDVLSTFFVMAALLAQSFELEAASPRSRRLLYAAALVATVVALLSKVAAMSCVLLLALHRVFHPYLSGRREPAAPLAWRRAFRETAPRLLPHAVVTVLVVVWYRHALAQFGILGWRGPGPVAPEHLANVARFTPLVIGHYLRTLFWPTQLSVFYRWPSVEIPLTWSEQLAAVLVSLGLVGAVSYCCFRRRDLAFYLLSFLALLVPYVSLVYVDIWSADRYIYLASFCVLAIAATLLGEIHARSGRALRVSIIAAAALFMIGSAGTTLRHESVWLNSESLWSYEAQRSEPSLLALQSVATLDVRRAESSSDPALRRELIERASAEVARGFERNRALDRQPTAYATSEQLQLSRLHVLAGRLAALRGEPLERQLEEYRAAEQAAPNRASSFMLAKTHLALALQSPESDREGLLRKSLHYFLEYTAQSGSEPAQRRRSQAMLETIYLRPYPFLRADVPAAQRGVTR